MHRTERQQLHIRHKPVQVHSKVLVQVHSKAQEHSRLAQEHSSYDVPSALHTIVRTTSDGCFRSMPVLVRSKEQVLVRSKEPVLVRSKPVLVHSSHCRVP